MCQIFKMANDKQGDGDVGRQIESRKKKQLHSHCQRCYLSAKMSAEVSGRFIFMGLLH